MGQTGLASRGKRSVQRAAQLRHLDEVIEMPGLQAGILSVVDEREQLARAGGKFVRIDTPQGADNRPAQDADRAGPALGVEGGELGEVVAADLLIRHAAAHTERERGRDKPRLESLAGVVDAAVWVEEHLVR